MKHWSALTQYRLEMRRVIRSATKNHWQRRYGVGFFCTERSRRRQTKRI